MTNNRILTKFQPNECQQKINSRTTRTMLTAKKMNYLVLVHCVTCGLHCNASCANIQEFLLSTSLSRSNMGEKTTPEIHVLTRHKSGLKKKYTPYFLIQFPRKLFFFESKLMYCDRLSQYIQVRKLFKGGNYSRKYGV